MPSAGEVRQQRLVQNRVVTAARSALLSFWDSLDLSDLVAVREALEDFWPSLIDTYGAASAEAAAEWAEDLLGSATVAGVTNVDQVNATARWALGSAFAGNPTQSYKDLSVALDKFVKQHGRDTIAASSFAADVRWARVPSGSDTCAWCVILASRGAKYRSAESAGDGVIYHGDCDCVATPIRDESDLPAGYDPDALYDRYLEGRDKAGSGSIRKIAAGMRDISGGN